MIDFVLRLRKYAISGTLKNKGMLGMAQVEKVQPTPLFQACFLEKINWNN